MKPGREVKKIASKVIPMVAVCTGLVVFLFSAKPVGSQQAVKPKRILVLYWYGRDFPGNANFEQGVQEVLKSAPVNVEYYAEYFESNRFPAETLSPILRDYLQKKYADRPIDVVVAATDTPLNFLLENRAELFPSAPIVFVAVQRPSQEQVSAGPGLTGVMPVSTHKQTVDLALRLHPDTKQLFVVSGTLEHDKRLENIARNELAGYDSKLEIHYLTDLTPAELISKTSNLPARSVVLYAWQQARDENVRLMETWQVLAEIAPSCSAPIYGMGAVNVGHGLIGGYVSSSQSRGTKVAQMALRILNGERTQDIPVENAPAVYMFDWRELRRWNISEANLPAGSIVMFRELTFWERYKWYVLAVILAFVVESLLIVWLLVMARRRRLAEREREQFARLAKAEHRHLNEVVSNVPGVVWEARPEPGSNIRKPTFISNYVEKMLGYTAEEWLQLPPSFGLSLIPDESERERVRMCGNEVMATGKQGFTQYHWKSKDGRVFWVESYLNPIIDDDGKVIGLRGVTLDVTARKQAEETLRRTEEKSSAIVQAIPDVIFVQSPDGVYLDCHAKNSKDLSVPPEELLGRNMYDVLPPELAADFSKCFQLAARNNGPQILEYQLNIDNTDRWFEARIVRTGENILSVIRDTTNRKLSEEALRESEERFRNMAETAPVMIWVSDASQRSIYFNQQWLDFRGRTYEQEFGSGWAEGLHPEDYDRSREAYNTAFERRESFRIETRIRCADGTFRWIFGTGIPRISATGEFLGYIGSCVDIHDRKQSEEALQTALAEVSQLKNQLEEENIYLQEEIKLEQNFGEIVGKSDALKYVLFKIEQVAPTESTVLITGETGTGKELVARAIHQASARSNRPLVRVNCGALSPTLIESEFFGHEKGAFTGALARKIGRFELADGATIFLDEIGDLPLELQVKLLRVIQEGDLERLGSAETIKVDVRIIAATNRSLEEDVRQGRFREDLWYRLNVFPITVPPLRQRREDIPDLVEHFTRRFSVKFGKAITEVSSASLKRMRDYSWPGNIRELANVIERAVINSHGPVLRIDTDFGQEERLHPSHTTLEEMERNYILRILEDRAWRIEGQHGAARVLGMNPSTLRTRMAKLGIPKQARKMGGSAN